MSYFPLMIQLDQAPVLLVGGGRTAFHKARILVDFGACVWVVAPEVLPELEQLPVQVERRPFSGADLEQSDWTLVVAATDCRTVNGQVSRLCRQRRIPVNVVDDPELCSFYFPALLREGEVVCAVSSGGRSPLVTQYVKKKIRQVLPAGLGWINEQMGAFRKQLKGEETNPDKRKKRLQDRLRSLLESQEHTL